MSKVCYRCLNGTKTIFCHDGYPNEIDTNPGKYQCTAWNEKLSQCQLIPHHYVLNTAGI